MSWKNVGRTTRIKAPAGTRAIGSAFYQGGHRFVNVGVAGPNHNIHSFGEFAGSVSRGRSKGSSWGSKVSSSNHINFNAPIASIGGGSSGRFRGGSVSGGRMHFPSGIDEFSSDYQTATDPNQQGRSQTEESDECEGEEDTQEREQKNCDDRMGEDKVLREFDYVRATVVGKGLVMGVASPPPGQVVIVKLNAGHVFKNYASKDLAYLGHVFQFGHLPDVPTLS